MPRPEGSDLQQRIVCAANRREGNIIVAGARHFDDVMRSQIRQMVTVLPKPWTGWEQGFIDNFGDFLTREEAWPIAEAAGQVIRNHDLHRGTLYSEHLY